MEEDISRRRRARARETQLSGASSSTIVAEQGNKRCHLNALKGLVLLVLP